MKLLPLNNRLNTTVQVDDEDFPILSRFTWSYSKPKDIEYAVTNFNGQTIRIHQLILPGYPTVDHADHNGLNNTKINLRGAEYFQQMSNRRKFDGDYSSKYKGVNKIKSGTYRDLFKARISVRGKRITLGHFGTENEAAQAYNEAASKYLGEFAYLNKITEMDLMDYIQQYLEYTKDYESPTEFFYWSMLTGIGACLRDNCYLLLGDSRFYPNIYTLIIAKPAMRKAKPLNSTVELLKHVDNTKIIEGRTSIQAVIQRLGETERRKNGATVSGASGFIFSEEISAMFTDDDANIPVLTDLYDFKSSYTSSLITRGTTRLTNVVVSLLGASNEELLKPVFNSRAIYGGLLSRCLIVYGDKVRHRNSLMYTDNSRFNPSELQKGMRAIAALKGYFTLTSQAKKEYDSWYHEVCPSLEKSAGITGAEGRVHVNVLKVAMLLCVSRKCCREVDEDDIHTAIRDVQSLFVNYRRLTLGSGKSKDADPQVKVLETLWKARDHSLSRRELMALIWADVSDETLDSVLRTFKTGGLVEEIIQDDTVVLKLSAEAVKHFSDNKPRM